MKTISIMIPTYNEEENVIPITEAIISMFKMKLEQYNYEILFIDNASKDNTQDLIRQLCNENYHIKAIFNVKNFGQNNSPYYGLTQVTGDCAILFCADFQDPIDMIPQLVFEWEQGYKIVSAVKNKSKENKIIRLCRTVYYRLLKKLSDTDIIEHFTGFGLYDRSFIEFMKNLSDPTPFLRGIVAEFGSERKEIPYVQQKRKAGKSKNNFFSLYDIAMLSFTSYTKFGLRLATFVGFTVAGLSVLIALVYMIIKIIFWENFYAGMAPVLIGMFFLGAIQLIFLGLIGEYILSINQRVMNRPLVIEAERINFEQNQGKQEVKKDE